MKYDFCQEEYAEKIAQTLLKTGKAAEQFEMLKKDQAAEAMYALNDEESSPQTGDQGTTRKKHINTVFAAFAELLDPTHNRSGDGKSFKYLHWICQAYLKSTHNGRPYMVEDFYKVHKNLNQFETWSSRLHKDGKPNQIDAPELADGFGALQDVLTPYQRHQEEKRIEAQQRRMTPAQKQEIDANTTPIYDGPEGQVLMIHSWEASKFWGSRTKWCITHHRDSGYFHGYNAKNPIIFYLPTPEPEDFATHPHFYSFKFAAADGALWNEIDHKQTELFPACLSRLAQAATKSLAHAPKERAYLEEHGHSDKILSAPPLEKGFIHPAPKDPFSSREEEDDHPFLQVSDEWKRIGKALYDFVSNGDFNKKSQNVTSFLEEKHPELLKSVAFMRYMSMRHSYIFPGIPEEFRDDLELAEALCEQVLDSSIFKALSPRLRDHRPLVEKWARKSHYILEHASMRLRADRELVEIAIEESGNSLEYAFPPCSWRNKEMKDVFNYYLQPIIHRLPNLRNDRDLVMKAVKKSSMALAYASPRLKDDPEIVDMHNSCYEYASKRLRMDKERTRRVVLSYSRDFQHAPRRLRRDGEFVLSLLRDGADIDLLQCVSSKLTKDPDFMQQAVALNGRSLAYMHRSTPPSDELIFEALKTYGDAVRYRARREDLTEIERARDSRAFFDKALAINGHVLSNYRRIPVIDPKNCYDEEDTNTPEFLKIAVQTAPLAVRHVLEDQQHYGGYSRYPSRNDTLQDRDTILHIVKTAQETYCKQRDKETSLQCTIKEMYRQLPPFLKNDPEITFYAVQICPELLDKDVDHSVSGRNDITLNAALHNAETCRNISGDFGRSPAVAHQIVQHHTQADREEEIGKQLRFLPALYGQFENVVSPQAALTHLETMPVLPHRPDARDRITDLPRPRRRSGLWRIV